MTTAVTGEQQVVATARPRPRAVCALGWREAKRILRSPIYAFLALFLVATVGLSAAINFPPDLPSADAIYGTIFFFVSLYAGLLTYMAVHLVSSSSRRTRADHQLAASPMTSRARSAGLCLGVTFGPGAVGLILTLVLAWMGTFAVLDNGMNDPVVEATVAYPPSAAELAQLLLTIVGAGLFGVLTATWLRFPGSLPLGFLILTFGTGFMLNPDMGPDNTLPWFAPYVTTREWFDDPWTLMGSQFWHAFYLAGLCAMAVCGIMLRERENRSRWMVVSAATLVVTGIFGWAQL